MMEKLPRVAVFAGRLGGWTQTRPSPSGLPQLCLDEGKRMLADKCLACGSSGHFAGDASCQKKAWPDSAPFTCAHCQATIEVTALGASRTLQHASSVAAAGVPQRGVKRSREGGGEPISSALPPPRLARQSAADAHACRARPAPREFPRVNICGHPYTSLKWLLGRDPGERQRELVITSCGNNALELRHGDCKSLVAAGSAKP
jgi:hypothetical protein